MRKQQVIPTTTELMNANSRFYLHRNIDDSHTHRGSEDRMGLFLDDTLSENEFVDHDGSIFDIEKTRRVLDLGASSNLTTSIPILTHLYSFRYCGITKSNNSNEGLEVE